MSEFMPFSRETYLKAPGADEESETGVFEKPLKRYPLFIHCLSGKDRTGSVVAAILLVLGIGRDVIREEYLLSDFWPFCFSGTEKTGGASGRRSTCTTQTPAKGSGKGAFPATSFRRLM